MKADICHLQLELPLPWQKDQWQYLSNLVKLNRLPHALLFQGQEGLGILQFAQYFILTFFCVSKIKPCQRCKPCLLIKNQTHPDYHQVDLAESTSIIKVDQIRRANHFLCQTASANSYKVLLLSNADYMNQAASNALLKSLEEPAAKKALIILLSNAPEKLLATIRSRCQITDFTAPDTTTAKNWLQSFLPNTHDLDYLIELMNNSPLSVVAIQEGNKLVFIKRLLTSINELYDKSISPIDVAKQCENEDSLFVINLLVNWHIAMLKRSFSDRAINNMLPIYDFDRIQLIAIIDKLYQHKELLHKGIKINKQLLWESIFKTIRDVRTHGKLS